MNFLHFDPCSMGLGALLITLQEVGWSDFSRDLVASLTNHFPDLLLAEAEKCSKAIRVCTQVDPCSGSPRIEYGEVEQMKD